MTISYTLQPNPIWYFPDIFGKNLEGGKIFTYESLNKTVPKPVYQDENATTTWPNPILLDLNGTNGPFYWKLNTAFPTDLYYLEIFDKNDVLQYTIDKFPGTGAVVSAATSNQTNLVSNGSFFRHVDTINPVATSNLIAPSLHVGFAGSALPDITFSKNNTAAVDSISFPDFNLGSVDLYPDITPKNYFNYTCNNTPAGETFKYLQIPVCKDVQNLTNMPVTFTFYSRSNLGATTLTLSWFLFYGDGGSPSTSTTQLITSSILSTTWTKYTIQSTVPDVLGKTLGSCGNDAIYLRIGMPVGSLCNIDITKIGVYLGLTAPNQEFINYDDIEADSCAYRTGDVVAGIRANPRPGWLLMNDTTIGSSTSGATGRANIDSFPLYYTLWTNVSDTYAPVSTGRGASAAADFAANKTIALTKTLGRALSSAGLASSGAITNFALGQTAGEELHVLSVGELAAHTHPHGQTHTDYLYPTGGGGGVGSLAAGAEVGDAAFAPTGSTGSNTGHNTVQPTTYLNVFIKL
jgi:hypothetical protein